MKDINIDILISRIESLAHEKGLNPNTVYVESKAGKNFKSNLKTANPSLGKITLIANYLNCSVDYLLGKTDEKKPPVKTGGAEDDEDVKSFSDMLDDLSDDELQMVSDFVALLKRKRTP